MIGSQLIYTSWKKGNSAIGGYLVYSKSSDITGEEEKEICAVMKYKAPNNLPYTPTQEEIETLFPKVFAYFKLSSGRFCIAQSSYIGQDYTNRWGNYIIHAYVLNDIGDLVPSKMIGANIFRTKLTEEELNPASDPEALPQVDIENNGTPLNEQEVKEFFASSDRRKILKQLAQSACDAVLNSKRINLVDDLSNMRMWITALGMILPKNILNQVYFSTYATENSDLITISCFSSNAYVQTYLPNDLMSIYADRINPDFTAGCYIDSVCNLLIDEYYDGILCANSVNKLMSDYKLADCDLAYKITCAKKGDLNCISSNEELMNIVGTIAKYERENLSDIFDNIFSGYSNSGMYNGDSSSLEIFKTLYPYISSAYKIDLLIIYTDGKLKNNSDACLVYNEIKKDCPCEWNEAVNCFVRQSFSEHFGKNLSNPVALLISNSWISVYKKCSDEQKQKACEQISALYAKQVASRDMQAVLCVLDNCKSVDNALYAFVYKSVCKTMSKSFGEDVNYSFEYLKLSLDQGELFWSVLTDIIDRFPHLEQKYIKNFVSLRGELTSQVENLRSYADKDSKVRQFIDNVNVYSFENSQTDSFESLMNCYTQYIVNSTSGDEITEKFRVAFVKKFRAFLNNSEPEESIKYAITTYENLYRGKAITESDKDMLKVISETVYNDESKKISVIRKSLAKTPFEIIVDFMDACHNAGVNVYPRATLMYEGYYLEKAAEKDDAVAEEKVEKWLDDRSCMFLNASCTENLIKEFLDVYMGYVLKCMYRVYNENDDVSASELINNFFEPLCQSCSRFDETLQKAWKEDIITTNKNIKIYFLYIFENSNFFRHRLKNHLEEYLLSIGKAKRTALLGECLTDFDKAYEIKMRKYVQEFNEKHMSFWDKVKRIFSIKKEVMRNDDEE